MDEMTICAELDDGTVIQSREKIPEVVSSKISKIYRIYITPSNCKPADGVLEIDFVKSPKISCIPRK